MKILHTSDWHLGKRLHEKSRLDEQRAVGKELGELTKRFDVDLVIVAGDVFDVSMPSAESEELFYEIAADISKTATMVVIAGNHDDPDRLSASKELARLNNIVIAGAKAVPPKCDATVASGEGWMRLCLKDETINIVALPFVTDTTMGWEILPGTSFGERVGAYLTERAQHCFDANGANIVVAHLFLKGGIKAGDERDIELGTARLIEGGLLPKCHYTALGHIHRPMRIADDSGQNLYYSGAILRYSFDEAQADKSVNLVTVDKHGVQDFQQIKLTAGKQLGVFEADDLQQAFDILQQNADKLVQLTLNMDAVFDSRELRRLKQSDNLALLKLKLRNAPSQTTVAGRLFKTDAEIFADYCQAKFPGQSNTEQLSQLFCEIMAELN